MPFLDDLVECQGCDATVAPHRAYWTTSAHSEPFCTKDCYERTMERRAERAHDEGR